MQSKFKSHFSLLWYGRKDERKEEGSKSPFFFWRFLFKTLANDKEGHFICFCLANNREEKFYLLLQFKPKNTLIN